MKKADLKRLRTQLEEKRAELLDRVREARSNEKEGASEEAPDLGDRAISTMSRDLMYRLTSGEQDVLRRVQEALDRMETGSYGECTNCGSEVESARLDAVPWAKHCIDCQELQDRGEL